MCTCVYKLSLSAFTGYVLGNLPVEKSGIISKEHVCEGGEIEYLCIGETACLILHNCRQTWLLGYMYSYNHPL